MAKAVSVPGSDLKKNRFLFRRIGRIDYSAENQGNRCCNYAHRVFEGEEPAKGTVYTELKTNMLSLRYACKRDNCQDIAKLSEKKKSKKRVGTSRVSFRSYVMT